jgi:hypothetical protein
MPAFHTNGAHRTWESDEDEAERPAPRGKAPFSPAELRYRRAALAHEMLSLMATEAQSNAVPRPMVAPLHKALALAAQILSLAAQEDATWREREARKARRQRDLTGSA